MVGASPRLGGKEVADMDSKGASQPDKVERGTVSNSSFDPAHVAAPDLRSVGECLLGEVLLLAQLTDSRSQSSEGEMLGWLTGRAWHATYAGVSCPFGPRPIGYNERPRTLVEWSAVADRIWRDSRLGVRIRRWRIARASPRSRHTRRRRFAAGPHGG